MANAFGARRIKTSGVAEKAQNRLMLKPMQQFRNDLPTITDQYADGTFEVNWPLGVTYTGFTVSLVSSAEIANITNRRGGKYYVKPARIENYIESLELIIDGDVVQKMTSEFFFKMCEWRLWEISGTHLVWGFGGPHIFSDPEIEDAYALGTSNVRSLVIRVKTKAAWVNTLTPQFGAFFHNVKKPISFFQRIRTYKTSVALAGIYTLRDLPITDDIAQILIQSQDGKSIDSAEVRIDKEIYAQGDYQDFVIWNVLNRRDNTLSGWGFNEHIMIDFWRDGDGQKALRGLVSPQQRRALADIEIDLDLRDANTELTTTIVTAGRL